MTVNEDKTIESDQIAHFLQKLYLLDAGTKGIASIARRATKLCSYEVLKSDWNEYLESMRNIMQLEACRAHMRFRSFVEYVASRDRLLVTMDPVSIAKRAGGVQTINEKLSQEGFPGNDRNVSGLAEFATVRLLREMKAA